MHMTVIRMRLSIALSQATECDPKITSTHIRTTQELRVRLAEAVTAYSICIWMPTIHGCYTLVQ